MSYGVQLACLTVVNNSSKNTFPNMLSCLERAWRGHEISLKDTSRMLYSARELFLREPNVVELAMPIVVVGDIHGQFFDLLQMFQKVGKPPEHSFLFLGDFVDRGSYSVETITLLLLLKITYPDRVTLLRGNHESRQPTRSYGFYQECLTKYNLQAQLEHDNIPDEFKPEFAVNPNSLSPNSEETVGSMVWSSFMSVFDCLPIAALVGNRVLAVHGGLSPSLMTIDSIRAIHRFRDVPEEGPMADLLWGDPQTDHGWAKSSRGVGWIFGPDVVRKFLATNNLSLIVRSHQMAMEGIQEFADGRLLTVWSAPNYTGRMINLATVLRLNESGESEVIYFDNAPYEVYTQHREEVKELRAAAAAAKAANLLASAASDTAQSSSSAESSAISALRIDDGIRDTSSEPTSDADSRENSLATTHVSESHSAELSPSSSSISTASTSEEVPENQLEPSRIAANKYFDM